VTCNDLPVLTALSRHWRRRRREQFLEPARGGSRRYGERANGGAWGRGAVGAEVERRAIGASAEGASQVERRRREDRGAEGCGVWGRVFPSYDTHNYKLVKHVFHIW